MVGLAQSARRRNLGGLGARNPCRLRRAARPTRRPRRTDLLRLTALLHRTGTGPPSAHRGPTQSLDHRQSMASSTTHRAGLAPHVLPRQPGRFTTYQSQGLRIYRTQTQTVHLPPEPLARSASTTICHRALQKTSTLNDTLCPIRRRNKYAWSVTDDPHKTKLPPKTPRPYWWPKIMVQQRPLAPLRDDPRGVA